MRRGELGANARISLGSAAASSSYYIALQTMQTASRLLINRVLGQNGSGQNGTDKMVWTKWYTDKMVLDQMVRTKWYG